MMTMTMATTNNNNRNTFNPQQQEDDDESYLQEYLVDLQQCDDDYDNNNNDTDDASSKMQDRFQAMFESSDRTQAGDCIVLKPKKATTSMLLSSTRRDRPLSKVPERPEEFETSTEFSSSNFRRRGSTLSTASSQLSASFQNDDVDDDDYFDEAATIAGIIQLQAAIRGFLERRRIEVVIESFAARPAPPVRTIRATHSSSSRTTTGSQKWWRRVSDITMTEFGESFSSYITGTSTSGGCSSTDPFLLDGGSGELSFGGLLVSSGHHPHPPSRSRNQSIDTTAYSVEEEEGDGDVSYTLRNNMSMDSFDMCLEKEMQHLDISGELKVGTNNNNKEEEEEAVGCQHDDESYSSMPRPPVCYRQVSLDTAFAVAPDEPARVPVRRDSQFIAHDVSSLTEQSVSTMSGSGGGYAKKKRSVGGGKPPKKPIFSTLTKKGMSLASPVSSLATRSNNSSSGSSKKNNNNNNNNGTLLQRFCSISVVPEGMKRISLDVPLGPPKRRVSKQRSSAPAAM